jgi:hypothetical protein
MKTHGVLAAAAALAIAGVAQADVVLNLGNGLLGGTQTIFQTPNLTGTLTGFIISYDFEPDTTAQSNGSWASDAALAIQAPGSSTVNQWGGYDAYIAGATSRVAYWTYDGGGSAPPGTYMDTRADVPAGTLGTGNWTVTFGNGWTFSTPVQYNNVTVTLQGLSAAPAPSAAAVLGLAGLGMARRRRR